MQGSSFRSFSYVRALEASVLAEIAIADHKKRRMEQEKLKKLPTRSQEFIAKSQELTEGVQEGLSKKTDSLENQKTQKLLWTNSMEAEYQENRPLCRKALTRNLGQHNVVKRLMNMKVALAVFKE
jgi:hypothetical protein